MPKATIYIQVKNWDKWLMIPIYQRSAWVNRKLDELPVGTTEPKLDQYGNPILEEDNGTS